MAIEERVAVKEGLATLEEVQKMSYARSEKEILRLRTLIIAAIGSVILTASSMYVALRMGALPWPTIFVVLLSMTLLRVLGNTNLNEINVAHTGMSAGALLAGGLAFTIPALWMLGHTEVPMVQIFLIALGAAILGTLITAFIRDTMIIRLKLPYPIGTAAFLTLKAGDVGGKKRNTLFASLSISAIFVAIRDWFGKIPALIQSSTLAAKNIFMGIGLYPMAAGIGYIIGPLYIGTWTLGAILSYLIIIPIATNILGYSVDVSLAFTRSLGIGLIIGGGIAIIVKELGSRIRDIIGSIKEQVGGLLKYFIVLAIVSVILLIVAGIPWYAAVIGVIGTMVAGIMAATITGQTGIDPMEIFGILVLLFVMALFDINIVAGVLLTAFVAAAVGVAGDALNDYKAGYLLETPPRYQILSELVGAIVGALTAGFVLKMLVDVYGPTAFGPDKFFVAPQAYAVSLMIQGIPNLTAFLLGTIAGFVLNIFNIPAMTIGIGVYLPMVITVPGALGGLVRVIIDKKYPQYSELGTITGAGLLGGEGIAGVVIALVLFLMRG